MKKKDLNKKLRAIRNLLTSANLPPSPDGPTTTEKVEDAEQMLADLELMLASDEEEEKSEKEAALVRAREKEDGQLTRVPNAVLAQAWTSEEVEAAKLTLLAALGATKRFYDKDAKAYVEVPDWIARITASNSISHQAIGMPVQRILKQEVPFKDRNTELLDMARTPSGRDMLLRMGLITPEWLEKHKAELAAKSQ